MERLSTLRNREQSELSHFHRIRVKKWTVSHLVDIGTSVGYHLTEVAVHEQPNHDKDYWNNGLEKSRRQFLPQEKLGD